MTLFTWNFASVVAVAATSETDGLAFLLLATLSVLDISDITQFFVHLKSSSISHLINGKSRDFQKLLKYFNGIATSASNILLSFDVLPIVFIFYSKDLLVVVLLLFIP